MKQLTLSDFQKLTGLSDAALLYLLKENKLACETNRDGALLVDVSTVQIKELIQALTKRQSEALEVEREVIKERIARIASEELGSIIDRAITIYLGERER